MELMKRNKRRGNNKLIEEFEKMEESRQLYKLSEINSHQKLTPKIYKNYAKIHRRASFLLFFPYALFLFANKTESMLA